MPRFTTHEELKKRLADMPKADLESALENIVLCMYGECMENDSFTINPNKDWDFDTLGNICSDLHNAGLVPTDYDERMVEP